jgi:hypothetical protein
MEQSENTIKNEVTEVNNEKIEIPILEVENEVNDINGETTSESERSIDPEIKVERRGGKRQGAGRKKKVQEDNGENILHNELKESEKPEDALNGISSEINNKLEYQKDESGEIVHEEQKREYAVLISGYVLLTILNAIMPSLLVTLLGRFIPKVKKVNPKNIALDKDEIEMLQPSADELVKSIFSTMSPVNQFFFAYTIITAGKLMLEIQSVNE